NLQLSCWYVAALLKRFPHPALLAGAYNAGPSAVARWSKERGDLPLDLWVEQIPFRETRGYVKQVVGDFLRYHTFYGDPASAPRLALTLPGDAGTGVDF